MDGNVSFKNNNLGNEPPGDGGVGGLTRPGLTRQGSIYSLTFDEFQTSLGKDFGSMNMDELLKNIWSAEETQAMASGMVPVTGGGQEGLQLQKQGSLTLPRTLSQMTVDQVWKDLSKVGSSGVGGMSLSQAQAQAQNQNQSQSQRQQTLGEVTLEEFLVRAGVVREEAQIAAKAQIAENNKGGYFGNEANTGFTVGFQQPSPRVVAAGVMGNLGAENANPLQVQGSSLPLNVNGARSAYQQPQQQQPIMPKQPGFGYGTQIGQLNSPGIRGGGIMGLGDQSQTNNMGLVQGAAAVIPGAVSPVTPLSSEGLGKSNGDCSSLSPSPYMFNGGVRGRKSGTVEKVVERRQRRMIKNRESAARSRARKQMFTADQTIYWNAYTVELEAEVAKLKEENDELQRKQAKIMEMQKNQEMELRNLVQGGPKKRLRRTESGPW
ncbi:ABSCISIC ACID-INSENSITIVE 5-like protein 5 isoform X2 [Capsella rubella]|uniref:ABSCISIC ACID-INSENSITIVE 5-like protein 5 isoform X2 n=1 Tax=Capsella rubella TaxID=81985 RepID=UPI000CD53A56|nr:ABSCISIC ACID-INSENSITIVE 5-like protein 5 isoform X2 [Capsella rubella]